MKNGEIAAVVGLVIDDYDKTMATAAECVEAIRIGDVESLNRLLSENPALAKCRVKRNGGERTLLHIATDWPGHFPNVRASVETLVAHGADVNAPFHGRHSERPLHWAASSDDVDALDALLDHNADIEAPGAVIGCGTPLADAVAFGQWRAARRLIERGARTTLWQAAALGLMGRVEECLADHPPPTQDAITNAFWSACHGGQLPAAEYLFDRGAELNWVGYDGLTALDAANRSGAVDLVNWLRYRGARSAQELKGQRSE
jgi:ankyrin repeat protein